MSCNGPCMQGRKRCPTPAACELDDFERSYIGMVGDVVLAVALTACILGICSLFMLML